MSRSAKRVILVTGHYLSSKRRAGFHWLADAFWRAGWEVIFFTAGVSRLLWIRRLDYRLEYPLWTEANRLIWKEPRLGSYVWLPIWHPSPLGWPLLDRWSRRFFARYGEQPLGEAEELVAGADLVVFESTPGLLLLDRFRRINPGARYVYRVSDDMRLIGFHPAVLEAEERLAPDFDLISIPARTVYQRLAPLGNAALHPQGIRKDLFDGETANPYSATPGPNLIFVGNSFFDYDFVERATRLLPKWGFHIIGPLSGLPKRTNLRAYGELAFLETVPYLRHADIALNLRSWGPGIESLVDSSLKVLQYTYCKLPIVAPEFLRSERQHVVYYRPGDDSSIEGALRAASTFDRTRIDSSDIRSWDEIAAVLAGKQESLS